MTEADCDLDQLGRMKKTVEVQIELSQEIIDFFKEKAKGTKYTPKQIMENMIRNWADGTEGTK